MLRSLLSLTALAATTATAIMIPPNVALEQINKADNHAGRKHGNTGLVDPHTQVMKVGCPGCLYAKALEGREHEGKEKGEGKDWVWTMGVENSLLLNISVGAEPSTLELNGVRFYPPVMTLTSEPPVPYIAQVPSSASLVEIKSDPKKYTSQPLRLTSWSFHSASSQTISESGEELLTIRLQLNALERQPISVPEITITALKNTEGQLMLMKIETQERAHGRLQECHDWPLLCKWRAIIADKLHGFKGFKGMRPHGCHKGKGKGMGMRPHGIHRPPPNNMHHGPGSHHDGADGPMMDGGHHGRPHHHMHHGGHRHHRHHKFGKIVRAIGRVMLTVFVPILLGVAAGMITYLLGMLVGAMVAFVYMKVRGTRRYQPVRLEDVEDVESPRGSMEKAGFTDEEEGEVPPPIYVEVEGKEVRQE